jgi:hypothetical protein
VKKTTTYEIKKELLYVFPPELHTHTYDFVFLASLTHPREKVLCLCCKALVQPLSRYSLIAQNHEMNGITFSGIVT